MLDNWGVPLEYVDNKDRSERVFHECFDSGPFSILIPTYLTNRDKRITPHTPPMAMARGNAARALLTTHLCRRLRSAPLLSLTVSIFLPIARSLAPGAPPPPVGADRARVMSGAVPGSSSSPLRRSTRSTRSSPYFPVRAEVAKGREPVAEDGAASGRRPAKQRRPPPSPEKEAPRKKARGPSKNAKRARAAAATPPAARTRSFAPAWWGNVLAADAHARRHPHAAGGPAPAPAEATARRPPVHTLILGTHPSIASLDRDEMYGHPQNAFWYLAGDALGFRRAAAVSPATVRRRVFARSPLSCGA